MLTFNNIPLNKLSSAPWMGPLRKTLDYPNMNNLKSIIKVNDFFSSFRILLYKCGVIKTPYSVK